MLRRALLLGSTLFQSLTILTSSATALSIPAISLTDKSTLFRRDPDAQKNSFQTPGPFGIPNDFSNNTVYPIGALLQVLWISEWPSVDISLCQPTKGTSIGCEMLLPNIKGKGYPWTVSNDTAKMYGFQDETWSPDVYFLQLTPTNTQNPYIRSHYFNITKGSAEDDGETNSSSTTASASSTSAANGSQMPAATTTSSNANDATSAATSAATATGFDALTLGARLGIYIGAAAIVAGISGAVIYWFTGRQRRRRQTENLAKVAITDSTSTLTSPVPLQEMDSESYVHETGAALPHEISSKEIPIEMPAEIPGLAVSTYDDEDGGWDWRHSVQNHARPQEEDR